MNHCLLGQLLNSIQASIGRKILFYITGKVERSFTTTLLIVITIKEMHLQNISLLTVITAMFKTWKQSNSIISGRNQNPCTIHYKSYCQTTQWIIVSYSILAITMHQIAIIFSKVCHHLHAGHVALAASLYFVLLWQCRGVIAAVTPL